jgi:hypothetical protein
LGLIRTVYPIAISVGPAGSLAFGGAHNLYYYTILRVNLIGLEGEGQKQIAEDARIEDRNHFEALVPRIYELGGRVH